MPLARITLVGAPNVGKSTLFNRLVGRRKALVHREPGMTRDVNEEECDWDGRRVLLADTGGLFAPGDSDFASIVRTRVMQAARDSDLLVFVVDGRAGPTALDEDLARMFRQTGRPILLAVNKIDDPARDSPGAEFHRLGFGTLLPISAEHDLGIGDLRQAAGMLLPGEPPGDEEGDSGRPDGEPEIRLAIVGRPNVGKSSLLNALLGQDRSLVSEVPGTTRDAIDSLLSRDGRRWRIFDTAGIRRKARISRQPEVISVLAARRNMERADVVLAVLDAADTPTSQDLHVAGMVLAAGRPFIVVLNKWDLVDSAEASAALIEKVRDRLAFASWAPILTLSALTGMRMGRLLALAAQLHAQAARRFSTSRVNRWLRQSVAAHHPPSPRGRDYRFYYAAQTGSNPPAFVVFTNSATPPLASYGRYLENSLREGLGLTMTPVKISYRERPRPPRTSRPSRKKPRRRSV